MTQPNVVQPAEGICPLCWGPSDTAGACQDCIDYYHRHYLEDQE